MLSSQARQKKTEGYAPKAQQLKETHARCWDQEKDLHLMAPHQKVATIQVLYIPVQFPNASESTGTQDAGQDEGSHHQDTEQPG